MKREAHVIAIRLDSYLIILGGNSTATGSAAACLQPQCGCPAMLECSAPGSPLVKLPSVKCKVSCLWNKIFQRIPPCSSGHSMSVGKAATAVL